MRKIICLALCLCVLLSVETESVYANEPDSSLSEETIVRVKEEVLTGNITSHEDVLEVALAQYKAMNKETTYSMRSTETDEDVPLQIFQSLGTETGEDGTESELVAVTGLLVLDENGVAVTASEYNYYRDSSTKGLDSYQVYATHTSYLRRTYGDETWKCDSIQLVYVKTFISIGGSTWPTKLIHRYLDSADVVDLDTHEDESIITSPATGTAHVWYPSSRTLPIGGFGMVQSSAEVFVSGTSFLVGNVFPLDSEWLALQQGW